MLPDGILPVPRIRSEPIIVNKLNNQVTLLEYLLHFLDPDLKNPKGDPAGVHFRVKTHRHLFGNHSQEVLDAIAVRNSLTHPKDAKRTYTETEKGRAVDHLFQAIDEVCNHPTVPRHIVQEVLGRNYYPSQPAPPKPDTLLPPAPTVEPKAAVGPIPARKPRRMRKMFFILVWAAALYSAFTYSQAIWQYARGVLPPPVAKALEQSDMAKLISNTPTVARSPFTKNFKGMAGSNIPLDMLIERKGNTLIGCYYFGVYKNDIEIKGFVYGNQEVIMNGFDRKSGEHIEVFKGRFISAKDIEGDWSKPDGSNRKGFYLKEVD